MNFTVIDMCRDIEHHKEPDPNHEGSVKALMKHAIASIRPVLEADDNILITNVDATGYNKRVVVEVAALLRQGDWGVDLLHGLSYNDGKPTVTWEFRVYFPERR